MTPLLDEWLRAVNQPVVDDVTDQMRRTMKVVSDNGNFSENQCKLIIRGLLDDAPFGFWLEKR